jgi:hypothetical protein
MLQLTGIRKQIETISLLSSPYLVKVAAPNETKALSLAYRKFVHKTRPSAPVHMKAGTAFLENEIQVHQLVSIFNSDTSLNDIAHAIDTRPDLESLRLVQDAYASLADKEPEFIQLLSISVHSIFCARSKTAGGGTTSSAIDTIWIDPKPSWSLEDFHELFAHELTHTLLFLDEHRFGHYRDLGKLSQPENYCRSAILSIKRPLDKVIHSILVATEILLLREKKLGHPDGVRKTRVHPPSTLMLTNTLASIADLEKREDLNSMICPRVLELATLCKTALIKLRPIIKQEEFI